MELILIRHGQAEDRTGDQPDEARNLTDAGRKSLMASMEGYACFLNGLARPLVWSSPLNRAVQTARLIADRIHVRDICELPCIGTGDLDAFLNALTEASQDLSDDDAVLAVVGHEPWLSEWSRQLCGVLLPFKKGAAAGLRLDIQAPFESELLWFAQPRILRRMER